MTLNWRAVFEEGRRQLLDAGIKDASLDARLLLQHAGSVEHSRLISLWPDPCSSAVVESYLTAIARRIAGEPVSRIIGRREFLGIDLAISPDVLDPRADTELLVETVLAKARGSKIRFCDIGTGSGAIAVSILKHRPEAECVATDISPAALEMAKRNAEYHGVLDRVEFCLGSYLQPLRGRFDILVSNPPYISRESIAQLAIEVRGHDPLLALDGGSDGLDAYRAILAGAGDVLVKGGSIFLEIGFDQAAAVTSLAGGAGFLQIEVLKDIAGHERVLSAAWPG